MQRMAKDVCAEHASAMLTLLNQDRQNKNYCDVILIVKGEELHAHRCVLGSISSFFKEKFKSTPTLESDGISFECFTLETMKTVLDYIYTGRFTFVDDNAELLMEAAHYFDLNELKALCANYLIPTLADTNCLFLRCIGELYDCNVLFDEAQNIVVKNFRKIIKQPGFLKLYANDLISIISGIDQKTFGSKAVYEGILIWVNHNVEQRKNDFPPLFKLVCLHLLPTQYLDEKVAQNDLVKRSSDCKDHLLSESLYIMKHQNRKEPVFKSSSSDEEDPKDLQRQYVKLRSQKPCTSLQATHLEDNPRKIVPDSLQRRNTRGEKDNGFQFGTSYASPYEIVQRKLSSSRLSRDDGVPVSKRRRTRHCRWS